MQAQNNDNPHGNQDDAPVPDQSSIVMNPSLGFNGSNSQQQNDMEVEVQQPANPQMALFNQRVIHMDPIQLGFVRVVYGPVLPPQMIWERSFCSLMPEIFLSSVPTPLVVSICRPMFCL